MSVQTFHLHGHSRGTRIVHTHVHVKGAAYALKQQRWQLAVDSRVSKACQLTAFMVTVSSTSVGEFQRCIVSPRPLGTYIHA